MKWIHSRWVWFAAVVLVVGAGWYIRQRSVNQGPFFDTATVLRGRVVQTVEVTGEVKPEARLELSFKAAGKLKTVFVKIGQAVKAGEVLAELDLQDSALSVRRAEATLAGARANLNARLAGETAESIRVAAAARDQALAAHEKAVTDLATTRRTVEDDYQVARIALDTASKNLENSGASLDQTVVDARESARTSLQTALGSIQTGVADGDAIIGVDNSAANDSYEAMLGINDRTALEQARLRYPAAKSSGAAASAAVGTLSHASSADDIRRAGDAVRAALNQVQSYLDQVQRTLAGTVSSPALTDAQLTAKKATIDTDRAAVSAQLSSVVSVLQAIMTSELTRNTTKAQLQNAYETAAANLAAADHARVSKVAAAENTVAIQAAALQSSEASLALKQAPPRAVDIAALRAQVLDAEAALAQSMERMNDARIIAPSAGVVADVTPSVGEQVVSNAAVINFLATEGYGVEALIPEADVAKVKVGQIVTMTLDAFGEDVKFNGTVLATDPDQTKVQDAIYYKAHLALDAAGHDVKPGMTVNVTISTGEQTDVIFVPSRAIRDLNGKKTVRILENNSPREVAVELGLRGDEGRVEVKSGLTGGESVIVGERTGK